MCPALLTSDAFPQPPPASLSWHSAHITGRSKDYGLPLLCAHVTSSSCLVISICWHIHLPHQTVGSRRARNWPYSPSKFSTWPIKSTVLFLKWMNHVVNVLEHIETFNKEMKRKWGKRELWPKNILISKNSNIYVWLHCFLIIVVFFARYGDCYVWNKVTTCIHNILSGRRWIEHYGEVTIRNTKSSVCICKLTFVKVNNDFNSKEKITWYSSSKEEINQLPSTASSKSVLYHGYLRTFQVGKQNQNQLMAFLKVYRLLSVWRPKKAPSQNGGKKFFLKNFFLSNPSVVHSVKFQKTLLAYNKSSGFYFYFYFCL